MAALVASSPAVPAHASDPSDGAIVVNPVAGAQRTLTLADLAGRADVHGVRYTLRAADGSVRTVTVASGVSVAALLQAAGVDPGSVGYAEISAPGGSPVVLTHAQVLAGGVDGPSVLYADAQGTHLLRPALGASDTNAADFVTVATGELTVQLRAGEPFALQIHASALRVRLGQPVTLRGVVTAGSPVGLTFEWYLGDGTPLVPGSQVTHRYRVAGRYVVNLNVRDGPSATQDVSPVVTIDVAAAPHHAAATGRVVSGAGGASPGGGVAAGGRGTTTGAAGAGGDRGGHRAGPVAGGPLSGLRSPPGSVRVPPPAVPPPLAPARAPSLQGELVSGTLLAAADTVPLSAGAVARLAAGGASTPSRSLRVPSGVWVALGLAGLVALGWALESRHTLPFWQP